MPDLMGIKGLITALRTLTVIPLPGKESENISASIPWFPVVGLFIGLVLSGIGYMCAFFPFSPWTAGTALLMVVAEIWLTRGLHLDGLADWADSIGGFFHREKRLAIMKDTHLGTFGVLALILILMAKWLAFERLLCSGSTIWFIPIFILSRGMMAELITTLPYARAEEGMGKAFVAGASSRHRLASHVLSFIFCLPFGPLGLVLFGLGGFITWLFGVRCRQRFGGITGDLLGTANETVEVFLLVICACPGKAIIPFTGWNWVLGLKQYFLAGM